MTVVSDTSPLRYLVAADQESLLTWLFGVIVIPRAVQREPQERQIVMSSNGSCNGHPGFWFVMFTAGPMPS